jgi:hypothetical protein
MRRYCLILIMLLLTCSVMAQESTSGKSVKDIVDVRLDKKVTLAMDAAKLEDVLKSMSESTDINFTAGNNDRDWRVRERRVTVYADDIPVGIIKDELSNLLGYKVSIFGKKDNWSYQYWQDLKAKQLEAELLNAAKVNSANRSMALRESAISSADAALNMSPEEAMKLREKDPWMAYLGGTKSGRGFAKLMSAINQFAPVERDLMLRGRQVDISFDNVSPELRAAINDSISGGIGGFIKKSAMGQLDAVSPTGITFMSMDQLVGDSAAGISGFGGMAIITGQIPGVPDMSSFGMPTNGIPLGMFPITQGNSMVGSAFADLYFALDEGKSMEEAINDLQTKASDPNFQAEMMARNSVTEKNPPIDPALTRVIEITDMRPEIAESQTDLHKAAAMQSKIIKELSRAFDAPVMLESFNSAASLAPFIKPGKQPLYEVLIGIEKAGYIWQFSNGVFCIRPDEWALMRSYEIPEEFVNMYKAILEKQGEFTLDDIANIAYNLTDDQIQNNLISEPDLTYALMGLMNPLGSGKNILRVYGSLNNQQKAAIKSEKGLSFAKLSNVQWDRLSTVIAEKIAGAYIVDGSIRLVENAIDTTKESSEYKMGVMQMPVFETTIMVENEENPRVLRDVIVLYGKDQIAMMKEMQKGADKANQGNQPSPPNPVQAP